MPSTLQLMECVVRGASRFVFFFLAKLIIHISCCAFVVSFFPSRIVIVRVLVCVCKHKKYKKSLFLQSTGNPDEFFLTSFAYSSLFSNLFCNNIYLVTAVLIIDDDFCSLSPIPISLFLFKRKTNCTIGIQ